MPLEVVEPAEIDGQVVSSSRVRGWSRRARSRRPGGCSPGPIASAARWSTARAAATGSAFPRPTSRRSTRCCRAKASTPAGPGSATAGYPAAMSIGPNPTFDEAALKIEAFLLDYQRRPLRPAD